MRINAVELIRWLNAQPFVVGPPKFGLIFLADAKGGVGHMGMIEVKDSDAPLIGTVTFLDAKGAQTTPDDVPQWASSDENVVTVEAADDGLSATVTVGMPGAAIVSVESTETSTGTVVRAEGTVTVQPGDTVIGSVEFTPAPTT